MRRVSLFVWSVVLTLAGGGLALLLRHPFPIDETRYLAVAWEMHWRELWLMPALDGEPYAQKPPLLFWLIRLGWLLFGVNELWPRLLILLFAVGTLWGVARLQRELDHLAAGSGNTFASKSPSDSSEKGQSAYPGWVAAVLSAFIAWPAWSTALYFDVPLTFWVVLGAVALVRLVRTGRGGVTLALAAGLGALTKGPLAAIPFVGMVLLVPWWASALLWAERLRAVVRVVAWGLVGAVIPLVWLAAVFWREGEATLWAVLDAQGLGRLAPEADHAAPWWWYLPVLLALLWPLGWVVPFSRSVLLRRMTIPLRFAIAAVLPGVAILSFVAGKRAQYLLPFLPFIAIAVAHLLREAPTRNGQLLWAARVVAWPLFAAAALFMVAPWVPVWRDNVAWLTPRWAVVGLGLALIAAGYRSWVRRSNGAVAESLLLSLIAVTWAVVVLLSATASWASGGAFDPQPIAARLTAAEREGRAVVWVGGKHHAAWNFAARRTTPLPTIPADALPDWFATHPGGVAMVVEKRRSASPGECLPWRSDWVCFVTEGGRG